jgi:hypothetical protein
VSTIAFIIHLRKPARKEAEGQGRLSAEGVNKVVEGDIEELQDALKGSLWYHRLREDDGGYRAVRPERSFLL